MARAALKKVKKTVRGKGGKSYQRTVMVRAEDPSRKAKYGRRGAIMGAIVGAMGGAVVGGTGGAIAAPIATHHIINQAIHGQGRANNPYQGLDPRHSAMIHKKHAGTYATNTVRLGTAGAIGGAVVGAIGGAIAGRAAGRAAGSVGRVERNGNRSKLPPGHGVPV